MIIKAVNSILSALKTYPDAGDRERIHSLGLGRELEECDRSTAKTLQK